MVAYYEARAAEYDDWYLRRGRYERGAIHDAAWAAELDVAGRWLDALPIAGDIVELAAGTGWWSPLLAVKGELSMYDASAAPLEHARERLVAHRLRAHLHVRDAWAEPDRAVDAVFAGFWLSHVPRERLAEFLALVRRWLKPGGRVAFIDSLPDPASGAADHPTPADDLAVRRLDDGRSFTIVKVYYDPRRADRRARGRRLRCRRGQHERPVLPPGERRRRRRARAPGHGLSRTGASLYSARCPPLPMRPSRPSAPGSWPRP